LIGFFYVRETRISKAVGALKYDGRTNPAFWRGLRFNAPALGRFNAPALGRFNAPAMGRFNAPALGRFNAPAFGRFNVAIFGYVPYRSPVFGLGFNAIF
jgi:hypothetical protein